MTQQPTPRDTCPLCQAHYPKSPNRVPVILNPGTKDERVWYMPANVYEAIQKVVALNHKENDLESS